MTTDRPPDTGKIIAPKRATKSTDKAPTRSRKKSLEKPLTELFSTVGTMVTVVNRTDGLIILNGADRLAKSLNEVAKTNDAVYRNLNRMLTGSTWGGVIIAAASIALPIAANHNLLPFQIPGLNPEDMGLTDSKVTGNGRVTGTETEPDISNLAVPNDR